MCAVGDVAEGVARAQRLQRAAALDDFLHLFDRLGLIQIFSMVAIVSGPVGAGFVGFKAADSREHISGQNRGRGLQKFSLIHGTLRGLYTRRSVQQAVLGARCGRNDAVHAGIDDELSVVFAGVFQEACNHLRGLRLQSRRWIAKNFDDLRRTTFECADVLGFVGYSLCGSSFVVSSAFAPRAQSAT